MQNTSWEAVLRATAQFPQEITAEYLTTLLVDELADLIRPCGFAKRKAATIKGLMAWYAKYNCNPMQVRDEE